MSFDLQSKALRKLKLPVVNYSAYPTRIVSTQAGDANSRFIAAEESGKSVIKNYCSNLKYREALWQKS